MTFWLLGYKVWLLVYKSLPQGMRCGPEVRGFGPGHEDFPLGDEDTYEVWPRYEVWALWYEVLVEGTSFLDHSRKV